MQKKVLSEIALYHGTIDMPEHWDIDREKIEKDILSQNFFKKEFPFSKQWDMLNTYVKDHVNLKYKFQIGNKKTWGDMYEPKQSSLPLRQIDPVDLRNSPDFVFLYGVKIAKDSCWIRIYFDDNRRAGRSWDIPLNNNSFVMFPSTQIYYISPNISNEVNFIQTITYEFI
jgi:hypothetical protein